MDISSSELVFFINGEKVVELDADPSMTLLHYIRNTRCLTGTKLGCAEGGCGACTVMCSSFDGTRVRHVAVNACLAPLVSFHGMAITTVEGIGNIRSKIHPVQRAIAESHGSQCGFCTPGIVMSAYTLLRNNALPSKSQLYEALDGNLCRCTGYRPILEGLYPFTKGFSGCPQGENCCQNPASSGSQSGSSSCTCAHDNPSETTVLCKTDTPWDATQEPIFPPELKIRHSEFQSHSLKFEKDGYSWLRPVNIQEVLLLKKRYPLCKIIGGNTEIGIETKVKGQPMPVLVSTAMVKELTQMVEGREGIEIGASVTLSDMKDRLAHYMKSLPEWKTRILAAFLEMLNWFGSKQIRNVATLAGNIVNASPISDLNPLLLASNAQVVVASSGEFIHDNEDHGTNTIHADENFFTGYKKTCLKNEDILVSVILPYTSKTEYFAGFKQANRKEDDLAIVNAGLYVNLNASQSHIQDTRLAFGGMAQTVVLANKTRQALIGRSWDNSVLDLACSDSCLPSDLSLPPGAPGGMVAYRRTLCLSFFLRFFKYVMKEISTNFPSDEETCTGLVRGESHGSHYYAISKSCSQHDTIGRPVVHASAYKQCTGEAMYMDDVPITEGELFLALVTSPKAHARLVSINASVAMATDGVVDVVDYRDVPSTNEWDAMEQVFASEKVVHEGQVVAAVLASSANQARRGARRVEVVYQDLTPIVTIQEAITANSIHPMAFSLNDGNASSAFEHCDYVEEGEMHVNAQEHFYLEPHGCVVYPKDGNELEVITTTQSPSHMQKALARTLGKPAHLITVRVKRLGGGFGGKETRNASVLLPTAVAAIKANRPVRCVLNRDEDMCLTGTRHPAYMKYKIGFNKDGRILAVDADFYLNMGCTLDLSAAVLETALLESDNAYKIHNYHVRGHLCQTNLTSCTAYRGFGGPQSIIMAENWISHVAAFLQLPTEQVREMNFYQDGDRIPCGQVLRTCNLSRCWTECLAQSDFHARKQQVEEFNRLNEWKKRGIAVVPLKYGLAFLQQSMNQGAALVNIYTDGSVWVAHGGVEMGQGLHTKMIQVVSRELAVPASSVHISETSTSFIPNSGPTAASMSSDLYGAALVDACVTLSKRLEPYREAKPDGCMRDWADAAHRSRVSLSACGFFKLQGVSLDWGQKVNEPFSYFSFGASCSEVELDCLTGDHQVLRTDIVMDVGHSLNPAIDVGQIEGGFIQGYGMYVLEDYKVSPQGVHLAKGPGVYKVPAFANIPQVFNVSLLKDSKNPRAIYSSKGIGEPPLCLASSVFMALKDAVTAARIQNGHSGYFRLDSPCTPDKLRLACQDKLSLKFSQDEKEEEELPWSVKL